MSYKATKSNYKRMMTVAIISILGLITVITGVVIYFFDNYDKLVDNSKNVESESSSLSNVSCNQVVTNLGSIKLNTECQKYTFSMNSNGLNLSGIFTSYDEELYTLALTVNGKEVTTDFFTNKEKKAIIGRGITFSSYNNYIIVKTATGAQVDGDYINVINSQNGNSIFTFENGTIIVKDADITIGKNNGVIMCDTSDKSIITGKTYSYKMNDTGVSLISTKNNTCAD